MHTQYKAEQNEKQKQINKENPSGGPLFFDPLLLNTRAVLEWLIYLLQFNWRKLISNLSMI